MWLEIRHKNIVKQIVGIIHALPKNLYILSSLYRINDTRHSPMPIPAVIANRIRLPARRWCLVREKYPSIAMMMSAKPP
jgi:hypothetical protein